MVLFPEKEFTMYQFHLFTVLDAANVSSGESLGSHMLASYAPYGGFNFAAAGISVASAYDKESGLRWQQAKIRAEDLGTYDVIAANMAEEKERYKKVIQDKVERRQRVEVEHWESIADTRARIGRAYALHEELKAWQKDNATLKEILDRLGVPEVQDEDSEEEEIEIVE